MATWPRRLMAGLLLALLAWSVAPERQHPHDYLPEGATMAALVADLGGAAAQAAAGQEPGCGPRAACSAALPAQNAASALPAASARPAHARSRDDLWAHLHRHDRETPPPRRLA